MDRVCLTTSLSGIEPFHARLEISFSPVHQAIVYYRPWIFLGTLPQPTVPTNLNQDTLGFHNALRNRETFIMVRMLQTQHSCKKTHHFWVSSRHKQISLQS